MNSNAQRLLSDKFYDKRKAGALEIETTIRNALAANDHDRISKIVHQLCHDYAYAVHQPHARNGGLIGLAAAAIALGSEVSPHLSLIVPPVLACFSDQDARVRYYACESMYNIAKVAKGEILVYFNDVFDALCKLAADTELSVKNGAELLDRLVKDIVSESAASYASVLGTESAVVDDDEDEEEGGREGDRGNREGKGGVEVKKAFSLPKFIPLLRERIHVLNPFTRTFLVSWITLLDSIPDLELVAYLPSFLGGLLRFLSDPNQDVHTTTKVALDRFLTEIKKIAAVKRGIEESRRSREEGRKGSGDSSVGAVESPGGDESGELKDGANRGEVDKGEQNPAPPNSGDHTTNGEPPASASASISTKSSSSTSRTEKNEDTTPFPNEFIPGQDVSISYLSLLSTLITFLSDTSSAEEVQLTCLKWIESFLDICPEDILVYTPQLLAQVLPALSHDVEVVRGAAGRVNERLMGYIISLPEEGGAVKEGEQGVAVVKGASATTSAAVSAPTVQAVRGLREVNGVPTSISSTSKQHPTRKPTSPEPIPPLPRTPTLRTPEPPPPSSTETSPPTTSTPPHTADLDYEAAVNALTLQFLHSHEATRVAALAWLIMLHRKSPRRILAIQDATFPALLKTLSDPAEAVVTRDLLLLSQMSRQSNDDSYFSSFMLNLLALFRTDRRLLETRGNLIIRQLCLSLSAEKIYRTMAQGLEEEEDIEFASVMVQNLNNNLLTAPELADLRKRLRNLDSSKSSGGETNTTTTSNTSSGAGAGGGGSLFTPLFRAWTVNAVATFSLCLLAQAYEQAYSLLQVFSLEIEMTVTTLIQIDKLVQLLESPVFTYLRMQLLEPERYPFLYKCLYGLLMLLPQSSAFAALKNRLGSVSAIGYLGLHVGVGVRNPPSSGVGGGTAASAVGAFERQNRLTSRRDDGAGGGASGGGGVKWSELLDQFKTTQERVRRSQQRQLGGGVGMEVEEDEQPAVDPPKVAEKRPASVALAVRTTERPASAQSGGFVGRRGSGASPQTAAPAGQQWPAQGHARQKSGLSQLGRLAGAAGRKGKKV